MAVKCNIPNLALQRLNGMYYGFNCIYVDGKIAQNYMEYLHCPNVDFEICEDFPCEGAGGDITCTVADVQFEIEGLTISVAIITFEPPTYSYIVELLLNGVAINTRVNPHSPLIYTGLTPATNYVVRLTTSCPGGETRSVEIPFLTMPTCVVVEDFTGVAEDVNEYP